jgi:divalent metal cation (Fe/Co/Zn/Cd) transporter
MTDASQNQRLEQGALRTSKWANLFMAAAGILAACLSNSQALLVDGLFSLIGFAAAVIGTRVSRDALRAPDARRPFGYGSEETVFTTFRALSLLALVVFAIFTATMTIAAYLQFGEAEELNFTVIVVYFVVIMAVCLGLWLVHRRSWIRTGRRSAILRLEADAALFDGILSLGAGAGLLLLPFLDGTPLGWIVPVGDSVVVLLLCLFLVRTYWREFRQGLAELSGAAARPGELRAARQAVREIIAAEDGDIVDVALVKTGRQFEAAVFYDPAAPVDATFVDGLTRRLERALEATIGPATVYVLISASGRSWPRTLRTT